ncbi:hypothetical protein TRICHSKD4_3386 [Roseibium sp. TrichSKD4]|nr:hypothetical protein TRICHSKD4_3386 [Roseibium sp. TrichSKD4]
MGRQLDLFPESKVRKPPLVRAHLVDAGGGDVTPQVGLFKCRICNWESGWIGFHTVTEGKRGIACPRCNRGAEGVRPELITIKNCATWESWSASFRKLYAEQYRRHGGDWGYGADVFAITGIEGWKLYYEIGADPATALSQDQEYWELYK